jgi:hypothetical protein
MAITTKATPDQTVLHEYGEPTPELSVKIERGQRGGYGWEVRASAPGHDVDALLAVLADADAKLREWYGPEAGEPTGPRAA